ncbi:MAG TPA: four helix bundle protein [Gemmatimonadales bacterium]|nr:four helix bundle protein [Gemmatimonadales bacterium]
MPPYRTLKAWQHAQRLAVECVKATRGFPEVEQEGLASQLRRACYSVPLNIAEGSAKRGSREYRRSLDVARGSLAEVETILEMARDLDYVRPADYGRLEALATETSKTLYGLLRKIGDPAARVTGP